jgi:hypothetical protein
MAALRVHLYRYRHPDGTAKDWAVPIPVSPQALTVFYGRTGAALRQADTPAGRCASGDPAREAQLRIREKLGKGYGDLGEHWLADNRRTLTPAPLAARPVAPPPELKPEAEAEAEPAAPPCLYWRWRPGPPAEMARRLAAVAAACAEVAAILQTVGWIVPGEGADADGPALWARVSGNTPTGLLALTEGHQPLVAFWLLVARRCPADLRLVDDAQRPVRDWPAALPVDPTLLETLGLQPRDLGQWLAAGQDGETWFF